MQGSKKNFNSKKSFSFKKNDLLNFSNNYNRINFFDSDSSNWDLRLVVNITSNNIFCTLIDLTKNKTLVQLSAGKSQVDCSRKLLRFSSKIVLSKFFERAKPFFSGSSVVFKFSGPLRLRRFILNQVFYNLRVGDSKSIFFDIAHKKCFNGCRPSKKKRKKNQKLRILK